MKNENEKIHPFDLLKSENAKGTLRKSRKLHIGKVVNIEEPDNMKTEKFHIKNSDRFHDQAV